jgi:hypothetical protein
MGKMSDFSSINQHRPQEGVGGLSQVTIRAIDSGMRALVSLNAGNESSLIWVNSICKLSLDSIGRSGVLAAAQNGLERVLLGVLEDCTTSAAELEIDIDASIGNARQPNVGPPASAFRIEGNSLIIEFGESQIEMRKDGTILFRGTHIASYSSGANRIRGTTIELN